MRVQYLLVLFGIATFGLAGCVTVPADRGYGDVRRQVNDRDVPWPDVSDAERTAFVDALLTDPLTPASAVRVAFVNNPRMQAEYARLGLGAADVIQAGRSNNPTLAATWQSSSRSSASSRYDFGLTQNFAQLLLMGARTRFSEGEFERAKLDATQRLLDLAARVQSAYFDAVGARQVARMRSRSCDRGERLSGTGSAIQGRREHQRAGTRDRTSRREPGASSTRSGPKRDAAARGDPC